MKNHRYSFPLLVLSCSIHPAPLRKHFFLQRSTPHWLSASEDVSSHPFKILSNTPYPGLSAHVAHVENDIVNLTLLYDLPVQHPDEAPYRSLISGGSCARSISFLVSPFSFSSISLATLSPESSIPPKIGPIR